MLAGAPTSASPQRAQPLLGNPSAAAAPAPALLGTTRIPGLGRLLGTDQPHRRQVRCRRARLRDREARPAESLRQPGRHDARRWSPISAPRSTTTGTAACWGLRSTRASRRTGTCISSTPTTHRRGRRRRSGTTAARLRRGRTPTGASSAASSSGSRSSADDREVGTPQDLIADQWCQQYPSHSIGDLGFGPDGKLYVSGGEGASFTGVDYGQNGGALAGTPTPKNPCGDPPAGVGGAETPPTRARRRASRPEPSPLGWARVAERVAPPPRPRDRRRGRRQPERSVARSEPAADRRVRLPESVPLRVPTGLESALARRRGLGQLGGDRAHPDAPHERAQLRLALLRRARRRSLRTRAPDCPAAPTSRPRTSPARTSTTRTPTRSRSTTAARPRRARS